MIADEDVFNNSIPEISFPKADIINLIISLMKQSVGNFRSYLVSDFYNKASLNEDNYTQIYIEQAQILIRYHDYPFNISSQYQDITNLSKGYSDFYFYANEQNTSTSSLFSFECKRLPSPSKLREKEYVIGDKNNGGIERYKTEKHGKGMKLCGLFGFVENKNFNYWEQLVNNWIKDLTSIDKDWKHDEVLFKDQINKEFCLLKSKTVA